MSEIGVVAMFAGCVYLVVCGMMIKSYVGVKYGRH